MNLELTPSSLLTRLHLLLSDPISATKAPVDNTSPKKILVAYSGGLDSHVLLHLLAHILPDALGLRAVYINHGLQAQSNDWAEHCKIICHELDVSFSSVELNLSVAKGESIEEVARKARYQALSEYLLKDEILVTAHHQHDQAETLLLQLFRGAGVQGLAAMPELSQLRVKGATQSHLRPLLAYTRDALEAYAKEHELKHIEDPSNKDTAFDRNFLRQNIMPLLRERWMGIDKTIARAASIQADTKTLLDEFASQQLPFVLSTRLSTVLSTESLYATKTDEDSMAAIDIIELRKHSLSKQRLLLRYWISQQGFTTPSDKKLAHVFTDLLDAADDKQPLIEWRGVELRRYQQHLYIMSPLPDHDAGQVLEWQCDEPLNIDSLSFVLDPSELDTKLRKSNENITVRFRQGGEKIETAKRGSISLKNLLQEYQIPPWLRSRLPLIYQGERLIKIVGLKDLK